MTTIVVSGMLALGLAGSAAAAAEDPGRVSPVALQAVQLDVADANLRLAILAAAIALLVLGASAGVVRARRARRRRRAGQRAGHPPTARREAEQLVQLLSDEAAAWRRTDGADERVPETRAAEVELGDRETTPGENTLKQASARFDAETLKRKQAADAEILNAKAKRESVVLKEKLATAPEQREGTRRDEPDSDRPTAGRLLACEVRWVRVQKASQFVALERGAGLEESTIAASTPFDWRGSVPPPESPAAAAALGGLIDVLLSKGWVATGRGEEWFASRFLLPRSVTRRRPG